LKQHLANPHPIGTTATKKQLVQNFFAVNIFDPNLTLLEKEERI